MERTIYREIPFTGRIWILAALLVAMQNTQDRR